MLAELAKTMEETISSLTNVTGAIEKNVNAGYRIYDNANNRKKLKRLQDLLDDLFELSTTQLVFFPDFSSDVTNAVYDVALALQSGREKPEKDFQQIEVRENPKWGGTLRQAARLGELTCEIRECMREYHKDLMFEDHQLYESIISALDARSTIYGWMTSELRDKSKLGADDIEKLKQILRLYPILLEKMQSYRNALANYIKDKSKS